MVEGKIHRSFTNFITTPELSGPLYISPDIYHTQITEYLLWVLFFCASINFLIVILLDTTMTNYIWTGAFWNTFPVPFQLKWLFVNSDQLI